MKLCDVLEMIMPAIDMGVTVEVMSTNMINLNVQAKSHCHLEIMPDGTVMARRRYDEDMAVRDFEDVLLAVSQCTHGRNFINHNWFTVLDHHGYSLT